MGKKWNQERRESYKGEGNPFYDHHHTEEFKQTQSERNSGSNNPMFGQTCLDETKQKISKAKLGNKHTEETKRIIGEKGRLRSKESIRKSLIRRPMSSLEVKFNNICIKNNLPYKFVGNGEFFIERKNPDFINVNGEKIAVEVYYKKHKENIRKLSVDDWKKERQELMHPRYDHSKYGSGL